MSPPCYDPARHPATVIGTHGRCMRVPSSDYEPPMLRRTSSPTARFAVSGELDINHRGVEAAWATHRLRRVSASARGRS